MDQEIMRDFEHDFRLPRLPRSDFDAYKHDSNCKMGES
jgi:hypothetical protein